MACTRTGIIIAAAYTYTSIRRRRKWGRGWRSTRPPAQPPKTCPSSLELKFFFLVKSNFWVLKPDKLLFDSKLGFRDKCTRNQERAEHSCSRNQDMVDVYVVQLSPEGRCRQNLLLTGIQLETKQRNLQYIQYTPGKWPSITTIVSGSPSRSPSEYKASQRPPPIKSTSGTSPAYTSPT